MTMTTENDEISKQFEVISINDSKDESKEPVVPHERQVVDDVIAIWKEDSSTETLGGAKLHGLVKNRHPNWSLSDKRVKALLKKFGLANNPDQQYCYASEISSFPDPNLILPDKTKLISTNKRGKGLFAKCDIKKGNLIWEEPPYFFIPPLANLKLVKSGRACSYCGKLLSQTARSSAGASVLRGLDCNVCSEMWCSQECKKIDSHLHGTLKHLRGKQKKINSQAFLDLEEYCIKEQWNALYAVTLIYSKILEDKTEDQIRYFKSMARVSQEIRYKALNSSAGMFDNMQGGALFVHEQQENLWKEGYKMFSNVFPLAVENGDIDYEEFMLMLGSYNINNLDSCIFRIQSHLNHCCEPSVDVNTSTRSRLEGIKVYAGRDIKANEELTTTYVNPGHTVQQRQRELRANWGFNCSCHKCKNDLKEQHRRKSGSSSHQIEHKSDIKAMLEDTKKQIGEDGIELDIPLDANGERRKSVRFDDKVIAVGDS